MFSEIILIKLSGIVESLGILDYPFYAILSAFLACVYRSYSLRIHIPLKIYTYDIYVIISYPPLSSV